MAVIVFCSCLYLGRVSKGCQPRGVVPIVFLSLHDIKVGMETFCRCIMQVL